MGVQLFYVSVFIGEHVEAGNILMRQHRLKFHPGTDVGIGIDHTLYALAPGTVKFTREPRWSYMEYLERRKKLKGRSLPCVVNLKVKKEDTYVSLRRKEKQYVNVISDPRQVRFVRVE